VVGGGGKDRNQKEGRGGGGPGPVCPSRGRSVSGGSVGERRYGGGVERVGRVTAVNKSKVLGGLGGGGGWVEGVWVSLPDPSPEKPWIPPPKETEKNSK